jgi:hypothetical protein
MSAVSMAPDALRAPTLQAVMRALAEVLPVSRRTGLEAPLELSTSRAEPPRLRSAQIVEGENFLARRVEGSPEVGLTAFLDGTQSSRVAGYVQNVPVVFGTVAAVIRDRRNQRLFTWQHRIQTRIYAPQTQLSADEWQGLAQIGLRLSIEVSDSSERTAHAAAADHPLAIRESVIQRVKRDRERLENELAAAWCTTESRRLMVDGGIIGSDVTARSAYVVGVVKSHHTMYVSGGALRVTLGLQERERSSVFLVSSETRPSAASWYLRLRDNQGHDPMWGLVRVEIAAGATGDALTRRADEVSRWILAEVAPVSLPDGRWHTMLYGVRDCEEFLRAIT